MTLKEQLLSEIQNTLLDCGELNIQNVAQAVSECLAHYEITERCTEIAVVDLEAEKMLKRFLATKKLEGRTDKTLERYAYILRRMFQTMNVPFKEIDVYALRLYLATEKQRGLKDSSVNGIRTIMCSFFGWLASEGLIERDPCKSLATIKQEKEVKPIFSPVELDNMRTACGKNLRDRAIIEFLLATGCRITEVVQLNRQDIDFDRKQVKVYGKGRKERIVYMTDVSAAWLRKYLTSRKDACPALFTGQGTDRMTPGGIRFMLKSLEKPSSVENIHPHRFRRTMATNLIANGMTIQDVAKLLGHANINTTTSYIYIDYGALEVSYRAHSR